MAVKIRLRQQGRTNRQTYRLVAIDSRTKRDGKYLENLGWYDPLLAESNAEINAERTQHWINQGAEISHEAKQLLGRLAPQVLKDWHARREAKRVKLAAQRRAGKKTKA